MEYSNIDTVDTTYGLYNGKMGLCLVNFIIERQNNDLKKTFAMSLLNEITDHIDEVSSYNFSDGLLGIGWGIEWLSQNKFIDINTDIILEDLDDEIYNLVMYSKTTSIDLNDGTLGRLLYFLKRITSKNPNTNFYKDICNKECLALLIDELYHHLVTAENALFKLDVSRYTTENIQVISRVLIMLGKIVPLKYNFELVEEMICGIINRFEILLSPTSSKLLRNDWPYLINAWLTTSKHISHKIWLNKVQKIHATIIEIEKGLNIHKSHIGLQSKISPVLVQQVNPIFRELLYTTSVPYTWMEAWLLV